MRNKYSEEYKTLAVKMVLVDGKTPVEVAHNLGKPVGLLYKWIRKHKGFDLKEKNDYQERIKRLENENQELKKRLATSEEYREILKKAAAYFAAQTL